MPLPTINNPLENAAPALQPVARPIGIPIGATPAPRQSPLMELGESFRGFNGELRNLLRDAAAREERDAQAIGELEAQRLGAAKRMGDIEKVLKQAVDEGKVSHARLPAFERGFRMRAGQDLGAVFDTSLFQKLKDTTKVEGRLDPEQAIAETYSSVAKTIHQSDLYARAGFDAAAQASIARFRQQSDAMHRANFKAAGEQAIADQGAELFQVLATSAAEDHPTQSAQVKQWMDGLRALELPADEVNKFVATRVILPTAEKLIATGKLDEARKLIHDMDNLDVTGKKGYLGATEAGKRVSADLLTMLERAERGHDPYQKLKQEREGIELIGENEAAAALQKIKGEHNGQLPGELRFLLINEYRAKEGVSPVQVQAFERAVHSEFEAEGKWRSNEQAVAEFERSLKTLDKTKLGERRDLLEGLKNLGVIPPSEYSRLSQRIDVQMTRAAWIDEGDFDRMRLQLFNNPTGLGNDRTIDFGDADASGNSPSLDRWNKLNAAQQSELTGQVTEFFNLALQDAIGEVTDDPNAVKANKALALGKATKRTRERAKVLLAEMTTEKRRQDTSAEVQAQAVAIRSSALAYNIVRDVARMPVDAVPGDKPQTVREEVERRYNVPAPAHLRDQLAKEFGVPRAERDTVLVTIPGEWRGKWASLPDLAKDMAENPEAGARAKASEVYALAKGALGFTPEEIKAGKTKHGVAFDPSKVNPELVPVFRSIAELNKHWNNGEPDETFNALGDTLDPNDKMTARQFYLWQRALLKR